MTYFFIFYTFHRIETLGKWKHLNLMMISDNAPR